MDEDFMGQVKALARKVHRILFHVNSMHFFTSSFGACFKRKTNQYITQHYM